MHLFFLRPPEDHPAQKNICVYVPTVRPTLKKEAWRLKMEPWRVCRPVVAGSLHFDKEQDPDLDPHKKGQIRILIQKKKSNQIRIKK
jgi:hypothetical protein